MKNGLTMADPTIDIGAKTTFLGSAAGCVRDKQLSAYEPCRDIMIPQDTGLHSGIVSLPGSNPKTQSPTKRALEQLSSTEMRAIKRVGWVKSSSRLVVLFTCLI